MLLNFSVENYKSIKKQVTLDFRKLFRDDFESSLIKGKGLPLSVIYGPNGGGKSTILDAIFTLVMVVNDRLENTSHYIRNNVINTGIKIIPFLLDDCSRNNPTKFEIIFEINEIQYKYNLECKDNKIIYESLYEKISRKAGKVFIRRLDHVELGEKYKSIKVPQIGEAACALNYIAKISTNDTVRKVFFYLSNNIGCIDFNNEIILQIMWDNLRRMEKDPEKKAYLNKLLKNMDLSIDSYTIEENNEGFKIYTNHKIDQKTYILHLQEESMGTQKIFSVLPVIMLTLINGTPIIIDEFDAKLHPKLLRYIIELFKNKEINKKGAQLIFTSHDISTLNSEVFRRDEIWFAAKNEEQATQLYSLADIRDENGNIVRKDASYSKQYLEGRYGADPYLKIMRAW
jgi:AAA15 family ATPase/GTPase|nr:MAG TPA: AAA domain protein [Caudoviricetes sp.]